MFFIIATNLIPSELSVLFLLCVSDTSLELEVVLDVSKLVLGFNVDFIVPVLSLINFTIGKSEGVCVGVAPPVLIGFGV